MVNLSGMVNTSLLTNDNVKVIISFKNVFQYLHSELERIDSEREFTYAILSLICDEALNNNDHWQDNFSIEDAIDALTNDVSIGQDEAYSICRTASNLVYATLRAHLPDFNTDKYRGKTKYFLVNDIDVLIEIDKDVFPQSNQYRRNY